MITSLEIKNYAIIDHVEINFSKGLIILTGETGAGKSIILGALGLIMGKRADSKSLLNQSKKCIVEANFDIKEYNLIDYFNTNDLDYDPNLIIRREILPSGKSRAFVNDVPVKLNILNDLSVILLDLHQQFDTLDLNQSNTQINYLDALANSTKMAQDFKIEFDRFTSVSKKLNSLKQTQAEAFKRQDFLSFQLTEFEEIGLENGEQEKLEAEREILANAEGILENIAQTVHQLKDDELSISNQIHLLIKNFGQNLPEEAPIFQLVSRLENIKSEIDDIGFAFDAESNKINQDPKKLSEIETRLDGIFQLQTKHRVNTVEDLKAIEKELALEMEGLNTNFEEMGKLEVESSKLLNSLKRNAEKLSQKRHKATAKFEKSEIECLSKMGMPHSQFTIEITEIDQLTRNGQDKIEFLFSANPGSPKQPIKKVASGGELSRLGLSIKSIVADSLALPILIFDEIDTGISGEIAMKMGEILKTLSFKHQIISITHSPQIASKAIQHLYVYKEVEDKITTRTYVKELSLEERVTEIAKMLSGNPPSDSAINNAKELVETT